jgi:hypothetical protein
MPSKKNDPSIQQFLRTATDDEKKSYFAINGSGATKRKKDLRDLLAIQKLTNLRASQTNTNSLATIDQTIGTYRNFWVIAEKEGGLMDREFGTKIAQNIATRCEHKGPPAVMWDDAAGCIKYLHCEIGKSDLQTKTRQSILSADAEMDPEAIRIAMQQASDEGLAQVPKEQLGNIPGGCAPPEAAQLLSVKVEKVECKVAHETAPETSALATKEPPTKSGSEDFTLNNYIKKLVEQGDTSSSSKSLMGAMLIQNLFEADGKTSAAVEPAPTANNKVKTAPREKTPEEILWQECTAFGRKLDGMVNHARCIIDLSNEDGNDWSWAQNQFGPVNKELEANKEHMNKYNNFVRTSSLAFFQNKFKGESHPWLSEFKNNLESDVSMLEAPLGVLLGMHSTMLKKRSATSTTAKKPKKA